MNRILLLFLLCLHGLVFKAQMGKGGIWLCVRCDELNASLEDTVFVSLKGIKTTTFKVPPGKDGCIRVQQLAYGNYTVVVSSKDLISQTSPKIVVKDTIPLLLDFRLKSSIIELVLEFVAYPKKPIPLTPNSLKALPPTSYREKQIHDSLYALHRKQQKLEHEQLKNGTWVMNDNLRSKEVLDTTTWKAYLLSLIHI